MTNLNVETNELSIDELNAVSGGSLWDHVQKALDGNFFDRVSKQSHPWEDGQKQ
jgi:bacteriocin-like protein